MKFLVTGGAGFIGRWVVEKLLTGGWEHFGFAPQEVVVVDNLSNGRLSNIQGLMDLPGFDGFYPVDISDRGFLKNLFKEHSFDRVIHLAACINVQESIDYPERVFQSDAVGTLNLLECVRPDLIPLLFMSTCMVYDGTETDKAIDENHPTLCASPYAGAKLAAENMVESYHHTYQLPTMTLRPFNTYGPYQKTNGEGGVVAVFCKRALDGRPLQVYGDGLQTRDLLYVEDCAEFIIRAAFSDGYDGSVYNAGTGDDVTILRLAKQISNNSVPVKNVPHIHPQSEIPKLVCDSGKARQAFGWSPRTDLEQGIRNTQKWLLGQNKSCGKKTEVYAMPGQPHD